MNMFLPFFFGYIVYLVWEKGKETRRKFGKVWNFNWLSCILERAKKKKKKNWEILISDFSIEITNLNVNICLLTLRWKLNYNNN